MRLVINKHSFSIKETKSTNYGLAASRSLFFIYFQEILIFSFKTPAVLKI